MVVVCTTVAEMGRMWEARVRQMDIWEALGEIPMHFPSFFT